MNYRSELVYVRAFYQDIARWAADDPASWTPWVAPCPIKAAECTTKKTRSRVKSRMDQRTRTQLPLLPSLLRAVQRHHMDAEERITTARDLLAGGRFTQAGQDFQRCRPGDSGRVYATDLTTHTRRNLTHEEEAAFWSWATVEGRPRRTARASRTFHANGIPLARVRHNLTRRGAVAAGEFLVAARCLGQGREIHP